MNGLALCAGSGGLELGIGLALGEQYRTVCYVERNAYSSATLVARMEDEVLGAAPIWDDIKTFDGAVWRGQVDIVSGGYPCQPFSLAGKRRGQDDPRHLWPDVFRIVQEVQPTFCFFENVAAHLAMGYADVKRDLEGEGYRVTCGIFSAAEVGGNHRRERLFILANRMRPRRRQKHGCAHGDEKTNGQQGLHQPECVGEELAYSERDRLERIVGDRAEEGAVERSGGTELANTKSQRERGLAVQQGFRNANPYSAGSLFPPRPGDRDGWASILATDPTLEPAVCGMVDGVASRLDRLHCIGNGVVPLVAAKAFVCLAAELGIGVETSLSV